MTLRIIIILLLIPIFFSCNRKQKETAINQSYFVFEDSTLKLQSNNILKLYNEGKAKKIANTYMNIGFTKSAYWLVFNIENVQQINPQVFHVGDPHINMIQFYAVTNDKPALITTTGDYYQFDSRPYQLPEYYFPINKAGTYLVKIDKHYESLQLYFGMQSLQEVLSNERSDAGFLSLCTGMILLLLIFGLYMLLISKDIVYFHYLLYLGVIWIYVLSLTGYGFQYLWPNDPWFASKARPVLLLLTIILSMRFMEFYIGGIQNKKARVVLHTFHWLLLGFLLMILLAPYAANTNNWWLAFQVALPVITSIYIIYAVTLLIRKAVQGNRMALFYLVAIALILIISIFQLIYYAGSFNPSASGFSKFGLAVAIVVEIIIITAGMAYRFNQYKKEKELLLVEMYRQQQENTKVLMEVQEAERDQIANQLHDVAGSLLSAAKLNLSSLREFGFSGSEDEKNKIEKAEEAVGIVSETVRNLSHALSPIMLQKAGFKTAIEKIVSIFNASGKITIELLVIGFQNHAFLHSYYAHIYSMVYELLNNVVKHSQATNALVQIIEHEDGFTIMVEDNGVGFQNKNIDAVKNNGLTGIVSKVKFYHGEIAFDSNETGLVTTIEIPLKNEAFV